MQQTHFLQDTDPARLTISRIFDLLYPVGSFLSTSKRRSRIMGHKTPTAKDLVLRQYPTAHVYDDGETVRIRIRTSVTESCPHCGQHWTHDVVDMRTFGSGGTEAYAWQNAARTLGLII